MRKQLGSLLFAILLSITCSAQLIINELSQGPSGTKEYVEFLVTGTPVCGGSNTVDLRGWIIDDNNSWHGTGSGSGIAGGHARFDSIAQWANVKIGSIILVFNDADMNTNVAALTIDTNDGNHDCVYIVPVSSSVLQKNITLPLSNGSMTTYAVAGTPYSPSGNWTCLGMANAVDAFHTVSPANYTATYHAIGWSSDSILLNAHFNSSQGGKIICMTNAVDNNPFNAANFVDTTTTLETPGAPNNAANAAWISSMNNNCQPFVAPVVTFNSPAPLTCGSSSTVIIASSVTSGLTFNWSNGATGSNDTVTAYGTYVVTASDAGNICTASNSINIAGATGLSVTPSFTNTICGNSNGTAAVTVTSGTANSFLWSNGDTTASVSNLAAGAYTVTVNGGGNCTATASVTINSSGLAPVTVTADTSIFCSGDSTRVCAPSGYVSYLWSTGAITSCIYAKQAGNYYVTVTDNLSCTATSNHLPINIYPLPPVSVSVNGDTLSAHDAVTYQWYFNNGLISGATNDVYIATQAGNYTVMISDTNGCRVVSNAVTVNLTAINELVSEEQLNVYPNPLSSDNWTIEVSSKLIGESFKVFDNNGRLVYQAVITNEKTEIELNLAKGIYWLKISSGNKMLKKKLIRL